MKKAAILEYGSNYHFGVGTGRRPERFSLSAALAAGFLLGCVGCQMVIPELPGWTETSDGTLPLDTSTEDDTEIPDCGLVGDWDHDGVCDDEDLCPHDPLKVDPLSCGCGIAEPDTAGACGSSIIAATCIDLAGVDWGADCEAGQLGVGVVDGACELIFGCEIPAGLALYPTKAACIQKCTGCSSTAECDVDEMCRFAPETRCGAFGFGECVLRPAAGCVQGVEWVCGCDGEAYASECYASNAGVTVDYAGQCADNCVNDDDGDGVCNDRDTCPVDPNKTTPGHCGCGTSDADLDADGLPDCIAATLIEDFESAAAWPWPPWNNSGFLSEAIAPAAAHDGGQGLEAAGGETWRSDLAFGTVEGEVLSVWCMPGVASAYPCRVAFGMDLSEAYRLEWEAGSGWLELVYDDLEDETSDGLTQLSEIYLPAVPGVWHRLEVRMEAGGVVEGRVYDSDGVTPLGTIRHTVGPLAATGIAVLGVRVDTIQIYDAVGGCTDVDRDGSCDEDDLCRGNDGFGDADGDGRCDDSDACWGEDSWGDADADGFCDQADPPADMPPFYDQSESNITWAAGGTCVEEVGADGPPACPQAEWVRHVSAIESMVSNYPFTAVAVEQSFTGGFQEFYESPYRLLCVSSGGPELRALFDDLNGFYHGQTNWLLAGSMALIDFDWAVNVWRAIDAYQARTELYGGSCELDLLIGGDGRYAGFHAAQETEWTYWTVIALADCSFDGCGCDATVTGWTNPQGVFYEDAVVNDSNLTGVVEPGGRAPCSDDRFNF